MKLLVSKASFISDSVEFKLMAYVQKKALVWRRVRTTTFMKVIGKMGKLYVASTLSQLLVRSIRVNLGREKCMALECGLI
jgi:hypothetical protein